MAIHFKPIWYLYDEVNFALFSKELAANYCFSENHEPSTSSLTPVQGVPPNKYISDPPWVRMALVVETLI